MDRHPLDRLTSEEIDAARVVVEKAGLLTPTTRFSVLQLAEPSRAELAAFRAGDPVDRRIRTVLLDVATGAASTVFVSVTRDSVDTVIPINSELDGQPPIMLEEFMLVDEVVKADENWVAAMARRGLTDLSLIRPCPLSAGDFGIAGETGHRLLRVLSFVANREDDHCWAHPVDGVVAYVDLIGKRVVKVIDNELLPIPAEEGNFDNPEFVGPMRTTLKPIAITQPEGPSFSVEGNLVTWEGWQFRVGFDQREGLVLHQMSLNGRPLIHRASISEMVVPYADPSPVRFWQNYFDAGEYLLGVNVNALDLGCDCLGEIYYFDAVLADGEGHPQEFPNAVCMHEEDHGVLWKHTDIFTGSKNTRRQRRLVISFFVTVGNYDYGFYWYLYLDGTIQLETKSTGVMFTSSYVEGSPYATEVAPGLGAPYHQHLFCARLDMTVDGSHNAVDELEVQRLPISADNPHGNAFTRKTTRLARESEAQRLADPLNGRVWRIVNPGSLNRTGKPVGYQLYPQGGPVLLADSSSSIHKRAGFATKHLWVTRYSESERYPAGELVNQSTAGSGLPSYAAADRDIDGQEIVVWHTFGSTHFPRLEDWPVMPVDTSGFTLKPIGFFDRNPTLDVPQSTSSHCVDSRGRDGEKHSCECC